MKVWNSFVLKVALTLIGIFTLSIALIRAQPYSDRELRDFLIPSDGCVSPCWQGIRPGQTDVLSVMALLNANKWVSTVHFENYSKFSNGYIRWHWSQQRPTVISINGSNNLWFDNNIAQNFYVETQIHFGDVWLLLGQPDWFNIYRMTDRIRVDGVYKNQALVITFEIPCTHSSSYFWSAKTSVFWDKELPIGAEKDDGSSKLVVSCRR